MSQNSKLVILTVLNVIFWASCCAPVKLIDPILQTYLDSYNKIVEDTCPKLKETYPKQIIIRFSKLEDEVIGKCISNPFRFIILIDKDFWNLRSDDSEKLALMYHELSHCILGLDHSEDPGNYMFPYSTFLFKEQIIKQTTEDIKKKCN